MRNSAKAISLSEILDNFTQGLESDGTGIDTHSKTAATADSGAKAPREDSTEAVKALRKIAQDAIEGEENAMGKEASEFGRLFAHAFIGELEKNAEIDQAFDRGYGAIATKVAAYDSGYTAMADRLSEINNTVDVLDAVTKEAYDIMHDALQDRADELSVSKAFSQITKEAYDVMHQAIMGTVEAGDTQSKVATMMLGATSEAYDATRDYLLRATR